MQLVIVLTATFRKWNI